eukprot:2268517-Alexandrium_andersonii.AAC.1
MGCGCRAAALFPPAAGWHAASRATLPAVARAAGTWSTGGLNFRRGADRHSAAWTFAQMDLAADPSSNSCCMCCTVVLAHAAW